MTRLGRMFRNLLERFLGRYHEGPEPPRRLAEEVRIFRHLFPLADARQWEELAVELAGRSYRDGFTRGFEWCERSWEGPAVEPERLAEAQAHDWSAGDANPVVRELLLREPDPLTARQVRDLEEAAADAIARGIPFRAAPGPRQRW